MKAVDIKNPIVKYNTQEISAVKSGMLYKSVLARKNNYLIDTEEAIRNAQVISVPQNREIEIHLGEKAKSYFLVRMLDNGNYQPVSEGNGTVKDIYHIITPSQAGRYIYSISVDYDKVQGMYYFLVDVGNGK